MKTIGQVAEQLQVSAHTLRYYEKISLLPTINKDPAGRRLYQDSDIRRVEFIKRAQRMQFSLHEIRQLLSLDQLPNVPKSEAQSLVRSKLDDIEENLQQLQLLRSELQLMLSECIASGVEEPCPIMQTIKDV